ncbi:MAG: D-alanine--D-alanine ligase, partial [Bacillota bacterium]|nr:D-alanine--D-alanine ligase [Bacillota bacterium]
MKKLKVAVLMGGRSSEREISLRTGQQVSAALRSLGHEVVELDVTPTLAEELRKAAVDVVYIALHGKYGEDGCIQGFLEILGLPYVGSGVLASALGMDKIMSKRIFAAEGIKTPPYLVWRWVPHRADQVEDLAAR